MDEIQNQDLSGGSLVGTKFGTGILCGNCFSADLSYADLSGVSVSSAQFAGSILAGTKVPEQIAEFKGLEDAGKGFDTAQKFLLVIVTAIVFSFLTILSTSHAQIVTGHRSLMLPEVSLPVSTLLFFRYGPIALLILDLFYQGSLRRAWASATQLPLVLPDGRELSHALPSLFVSAAFFGKPNDNPGFVGLASNTLGAMTAWGITPLAMLFFWWVYLPRREFGWSAVHSMMFAAACFLSLSSASYLIRQSRHYNDRAIRRILASTRMAPIVSLFAGVLLVCVTKFLLGFLSINFEGAAVSELPGDWKGTDEQVPLVKGVEFENRDLSGLIANRAVFVGSMFRECEAFAAQLASADLRGCSFHKVNLEQANVSAAKLQNAKVKLSNFRGADFSKSVCASCELIDCNMSDLESTGAVFSGATTVNLNLENANLTRCKFENANLLGANLKNTQLIFASLKATILVKANLEGANVSGANLENASLRLAKLKNADFTNAKLDGADFRETNLQPTKGLTKEQLEKAVTDKTTIFPVGW